MAVYTVSITDGTTLSSLAVSAGRGPKGKGFTGGSYDKFTGKITFTSNDGIDFETDDIRPDPQDLTSPGPIGTSTPEIGAFTDLSSTNDALIHELTVGRGAGSLSRNTVVGYDALSSNTTGTENTASGYRALRENTTGGRNTATGYLALSSNTTGTENTATGFQAMLNNTTGGLNTATGYLALNSNTTGNNNTGVGFKAGGPGSPFVITTQSDRIVMGNNSHTDAYIKVSWTVTSDARDKTEFAPIPHGLSFINAIEPTEYQFKAGGRDSEQGDGKRRYGFLAQDVLALEGDNPVIVDTEDPENLKLKESQIVPVLVNAVKELSSQVEDLKVEVKNLKETENG